MVFGEGPNCHIYLDDVVIRACTWAEQMSILHDVFCRLSAASSGNFLRLQSLRKTGRERAGTSLGCKSVCCPLISYYAPATRRELRRFLWMAGNYRSFCKNFSSVLALLTRVCSSKVDFFLENGFFL